MSLKSELVGILKRLWYMGNRHDREVDVNCAYSEILILLKQNLSEWVEIDKERLRQLIVDSDLYQTFIGQNVDYSSVEKKLAHAITQSKILKVKGEEER